MKWNLVCIGALLMGLPSCTEEKEEVSAQDTIPSRPAPPSRSSSLKPTRPVELRSPATRPSINPAPEQTPLTQEELDAQKLEREAQQVEREARRNEQREQRAAQMTEQITSRLKSQDADGDGLLSMEEVSDRMKSRFGDADANGDGYLDASEQDAVVQEFSKRMSESNRGRGGRGFEAGSADGRRGGRGGGGDGGRRSSRGN
ncbi:hypothetical protein ACFQY0_17885 [Haloferula chungangensis]|uniref:EF-hand domain-containing protein n=1 Tax=Haloferula chungangensis TaxID=1048331 RepID=A0ABW2LB90_9BACT